MNDLDAFLHLYGANYPEDAISYIRENFDNDEINDKADILRQIRAHLGLIKQDKNIYLGFLKEVQKMQRLDQDILEIGCGLYPTLSEYIALEQKGTCATITALDPLLIPDKLSGIRLIKNSFSAKFDSKKFDVLLGTQPCDATISIIENAAHYHKPYSILLCGCTHFSGDEIRNLGWPILSNTWENYILKKANDCLDDGFVLHTQYLEESYEYPYKLIQKIPHKKTF